MAELDGSRRVVALFVYGERAHVPSVVVRIDPGSGRRKAYRVVTDHLGSVRLVVDAGTGEVVQRIGYGPWGEVLEDTNPGFQPFGFAGGIYDSDTGLVRFGARDYDAEVGRWTAVDPMLFSDIAVNLYAYSIGDPINFVDNEGAAPRRPRDEVGEPPSGHRSNARESVRERHEKGDARRARDRGGERGDARRRLPRKRPKGWKGPWPPRVPIFVPFISWEILQEMCRSGAYSGPGCVENEQERCPFDL